MFHHSKRLSVVSALSLAVALIVGCGGSADGDELEPTTSVGVTVDDVACTLEADGSGLAPGVEVPFEIENGASGAVSVDVYRMADGASADDPAPADPEPSASVDVRPGATVEDTLVLYTAGDYYAECTGIDGPMAAGTLKVIEE